MRHSLKQISITIVILFTVLIFLAARIHLNSSVFPIYRSGIDCIPITHPPTPPHIRNSIPTARYGNITCPIKPKILPIPGPKVALASFPGSGNSWVRFLLEQSTGFYTGSVYIDRELWSYGFLESVFNSSVIAIKTHEAFGIINKYFFKSVDYEKCILIVRNPKHILVAEINRFFTKNHTESLKASRWRSERVQQKMLELIFLWKSFMLAWLHFSKPIIVVQFEKLLSNYRAELERILHFLDLDFIPEGAECLEHNNSGFFKRSQRSEPYFSPEVLLLIQHSYSVVQPLLAKYNVTYPDLVNLSIQSLE